MKTSQWSFIKELGVPIRDSHDALLMVVDDVPQNILLVEAVLEESGYKVVTANSGKEALEIMLETPPDLLLLDMMMPEMNGIEVCSTMQNKPSLSQIPVIFLTAFDDKVKLVQAFNAGAIDYVTKPFDQDELLARVKSHLELKLVRDGLVATGTRLKEILAEKDELIGIAAHDLRNPLASISGFAQVILSGDANESEKVEFLTLIRKQSERMFAIIKNVLDINVIERGGIKPQKEAIDVRDVFHTMLASYEIRSKQKNQVIELHLEGDDFSAITDMQILMQIIDNLVTNAQKYSEKGKRIIVSLRRESQELIFSVKDEGPGLSKSDQEKLFKKYSKLSPTPTDGESSTGLGLSITQKLAKLIGASITCQSELGKGSEFCIHLPITTPAKD